MILQIIQKYKAVTASLPASYTPARLNSMPYVNNAAHLLQTAITEIEQALAGKILPEEEKSLAEHVLQEYKNRLIELLTPKIKSYENGKYA